MQAWWSTVLGTKNMKKNPKPREAHVPMPTIFFYFLYGGPTCFGPKVYCDKLKEWKMGMLQTKRTMVNFFRQF